MTLMQETTVDAMNLPPHDVRPTSPASNAVRLTRSQLRAPPLELSAVEPKSLVQDKLKAGQHTTQEVDQQRAASDVSQSVDETADSDTPDGTHVLDDPFPMRDFVQMSKGDAPVRSPAHGKVGAGTETSNCRHMETSASSSNSDETKKANHFPLKSATGPSQLARDQIMVSEGAEGSTEYEQASRQYDELEQAAVDASTPPRSERVKIPAIPVKTYDDPETAALTTTTSPRTSSKPRSPAPTQEDVVSAMDRFDDEVEKVNAELPEIQTSPEKSRTRKVTPVVRTTKASQARISLAHGPNDAARAPALGRPRQSSARESKAQVQLSQSTAAKRITSTTSVKARLGPSEEEDTIEKKAVNIPHSKPRPMSLQFPNPPPPPKSTKAPTKSTFQLPGEAIAAKLKAAKEARLEKEAESAPVKKAFKARPAPSFAGKPPPAVRQTSTSKARESIISGKPATGASSKRPHSVATTRPATSKAPGASNTKTPARLAPKPVSSVKPTSNAVKPSRPVSGVPPHMAKSLNVAKRPSTVTGTINKPRASLAPKPNPPATARKGNGTVKGKEVFNRAAQAKTNAEREKREKEEAAKKARAAAAERGRQASRDWAEKQRLKKLGLKLEPKAAEDEATQVAIVQETSEVPVAEESVEEPISVQV